MNITRVESMVAGKSHPVTHITLSRREACALLSAVEKGLPKVALIDEIQTLLVAIEPDQDQVILTYRGDGGTE